MKNKVGNPATSNEKSESNVAPEVVFDPAVSLSRLKTWFPDLPEATCQALVRYQTELVDFNKVVSLVSPPSAKVAESLHIADSILASQLIRNSLIPNAPLYESGGGNGFPGLIFGLLYPDVKVVIVEKDGRKTEFCKHIANLLSLGNVSFMGKSLEELPERSISNLVGRGMGSLQKSLLLCRKPVGKGGRFFHMKGDGWANDLAQVTSQLFSFWSPSLVGQYRIPSTGFDMVVVLTEKTAD